MKQTISVLVENQAGVLNRITNLFSRRAFNNSGNSVVEQVEKQLNKLVDVIKVRTLDDDKMIARELLIVKVSCTVKTRTDIMNLCQIMGAKIADVSPNTMTLELSDTGDRLELFLSLLRPFSILEVARTGLIAVQKGSGKM